MVDTSITSNTCLPTLSLVLSCHYSSRSHCTRQGPDPPPRGVVQNEQKFFTRDDRKTTTKKELKNGKNLSAMRVSTSEKKNKEVVKRFK